MAPLPPPLGLKRNNPLAELFWPFSPVEVKMVGWHGRNVDIRDRWTAPPDSALADVEIRAIRGAQVMLLRAALIGILGQERADALAGTLSPSASKLVLAAPEADAWVPIDDIRELAFRSGIIKPALMESLVRLTAKRDAGQLLLFDPPGGEKLPGGSPRDLALALDAIYVTKYKGGRAHLDALDAQEAWVSFWVKELWPDWASRQVTEWFKRVLEDHYKVRSAVTYVAPPEDRPWWHRYHLRWF